MSLSTETLTAQGSRRLSLAMLSLRARADAFSGLVEARPLSLLAAFQEAEPYLGLPPQTFKLVAWLVKMTKSQDWAPESRPIVWPSAARQQEFLGLTPSAVKTLNRTLYEAGIFVLRDSPTGKRYGRRDAEGRIIEAYGFDLSPLAFRAEEFIRLAAEARIARERLQRLRRRVTCARRAIAQIGEVFASALPPDWPRLAQETAALVASARKAQGAEEMGKIVVALESRQAEAEAWIILQYNAPEGPADRPLIISTNPILNPSDTVPATEESSRGEGKPLAEVRPEELLRLAPRLSAYVAARFPEWSEIETAASEGLRHELGVSPSLWREACVGLGRRRAAVALAIVSTKPAEHFQRGPGGYFAAMIKRGARGELRLDRSLWKLRRDRLEALVRRS